MVPVPCLTRMLIVRLVWGIHPHQGCGCHAATGIIRRRAPKCREAFCDALVTSGATFVLRPNTRCFITSAPMLSDIVYFDLETQRTANDAGGWDRKRDMGMSIGVTYSTKLGE